MAVCLWLSVKFYEDINFTDAYYATKIAGLTTKELISLQFDLLELLNYRLFISTHRFNHFVSLVQSLLTSSALLAWISYLPPIIIPLIPSKLSPFKTINSIILAKIDLYNSIYQPSRSPTIISLRQEYSLYSAAAWKQDIPSIAHKNFNRKGLIFTSHEDWETSLWNDKITFLFTIRKSFL